MMMNTFIKEFSLYLGIPTSITPVKDIALAALTSLIATLAVLYFSQFFLNYMNITEHN
jgi:hypothetical protein